MYFQGIQDLIVVTNLEPKEQTISTVSYKVPEGM